MCFMVHHASDEMMVQTLEMLPFCGEFTLLNNTKKKKKRLFLPITLRTIEGWHWLRLKINMTNIHDKQ